MPDGLEDADLAGFGERALERDGGLGAGQRRVGRKVFGAKHPVDAGGIAANDAVLIGERQQLRLVEVTRGENP